MQGLAGSGGSAGEGAGGSKSGGSGSSAGGPSAGYGAKVAARVKPNIVYPDAISGNPRAEVRVRTAPDGTITGATIAKSSGNKAWDDAVIRALQKTETLPRDIDGRVPSDLVIGFRPQD
jgi:colicin import membrane protein